jgi:phospholipid/cholesterol/gamma-HCH transport system substrate-binding protein
MNENKNTELLAGFFLLIGLLSFFYFSVFLGGIELSFKDSYKVSAKFDSVSGLKQGASVEIAGVRVGKVTEITLDGSQALIYLQITKGVPLEGDTIAAVRTKGLIGEKYIKLIPGGEPIYLEDGEEILDTESTMDIEELIGKFIYDKE